MRPTRRKLEFTKESVNDLFQEIYIDSHNIKAKINRLFLKWEKFAKEGGDIAAIGEQIIKLIAVEAKNQDQKIMLLKYLKEVVFVNNNEGGSSNTSTNKEEEGTLTAEKKNALMDMVQKALNSGELNKKSE
jgi:hypothetical protein